jgi:hypothetical protein
MTDAREIKPMTPRRTTRTCRDCWWFTPHMQTKYMGEIPQYCGCIKSRHYGDCVASWHRACPWFKQMPGSNK